MLEPSVDTEINEQISQFVILVITVRLSNAGDGWGSTAHVLVTSAI